MQGNNLFEYAIIRVVPRPEREEFLNVGVILFCSGRNYLDMRYTLNKQRLTTLCAEVDCSGIIQHLEAFEEICRGITSSSSPIARLDKPSRFRWLTATRSTVVQTSKVHPGFCDDPQETLERLHDQMVL